MENSMYLEAKNLIDKLKMMFIETGNENFLKAAIGMEDIVKIIAEAENIVDDTDYHSIYPISTKSIDITFF